MINGYKGRVIENRLEIEMARMRDWLSKLYEHEYYEKRKMISISPKSNLVSKKSAPTIGSATVAVKCLPGNSTNFIAVVPS